MEPVYQAIYADNMDFNEVLISPTMVNDHMPDKVMEALEKVSLGYISCGLFTCMETDMGSEYPILKNSPRIGLWLQLYSKEIFTLQTKENDPHP